MDVACAHGTHAAAVDPLCAAVDLLERKLESSEPGGKGGHHLGSILLTCPIFCLLSGQDPTQTTSGFMIQIASR